ncbi:hypothetical protein GCM10027217_27780 [Pseudomaricurvus hydrocarbonicus]
MIFGVVWSLFPEKDLHSYIFTVGVFEALILALIEARDNRRVLSTNNEEENRVKEEIFRNLKNDENKLGVLINTILESAQSTSIPD